MSSILVVVFLAVFFAITPVCLLISVGNIKHLKIAYTFLIVYYSAIIFIGVFTKIRVIDIVTIRPYRITSTDRFFNFRLYTPNIRDFFLNVVMFIPFGFFISLFFKENKLAKATFVGMLVSIFIESTQYFLPGVRCAELSDIILNTLGCAVGSFAFIIIYLLREKIHIKYTAS